MNPENQQVSETSPAEGEKPAGEGHPPENHPPKKKSHAHKAGKKHSLGGLVSGLALLAAVGAGGGVYYLFTLQQGNKPILEAQAQRLDAFNSKIASLQSALRTTQTSLEAEAQARKKAEAEHQALATAMASLESKLGRTTLAWRLAEVEYLLTIANDRIALEQDANTAKAILETADAKLEGLGDPALLPVRQKLSQELTALAAVPKTDITGMALALGSLAESLRDWPLVDKTAPGVLGKPLEPKGRALTWQEIPQAVWEDLKGLIKVRRHEQPVEPLLPPEQAWFLRENLRLKLEQARLALLRQDQALFQQILSEAMAWLKLFFDGESAAVSNAMQTLEKYHGTKLTHAQPDISGSLRELRGQIQRLGQQASRP